MHAIHPSHWAAAGAHARQDLQRCFEIVTLQCFAQAARRRYRARSLYCEPIVPPIKAIVMVATYRAGRRDHF
jgi:hypothetical protein